MADISHIFNNPRPILSPEQQLIDAIAESGLNPPEMVYLDGKIHRFASKTTGTGEHSDKPGWYIAFSDGVPAGRFGCWRAGVESSWVADIGRELDASELLANSLRMAEAKALRDAESKQRHESAAKTSAAIWSSGMAASADHPYLKRKGIQPHGARLASDGRLIVPLYSKDGELSSIQYIAEDGEKRYQTGGATGGKFWMLGTKTPTIYIAEGFATAATIEEVTKMGTLVAYSASNLVSVVESAHELFPEAEIVIVADNDMSGTGQRYAEQASAKHGGRVVMPPIVGQDINDYQKAGGDILGLLMPPDTWLIQADDFCSQPAPISWLIKGWVQSKSLMMIHGPSGGGKTFVMLDWCLTLASGGGEWAGKKAKPCAVVYLAGEGHHGLKSRIAAWKTHHGAEHLNMWVSPEGCDLNTADGLRRVVDSIRQLKIECDVLIVVDTLHRFLSGDENSAQDAKTMLDACAVLMRTFDCAVSLVHHTGVSTENQERARGSSAWRGALDIEISVIPSKGESPLQIVQRKSKDAELSTPIFADLKKVIIPGWIDEDGEPVSSAVVEIVDAPAHATAKTESKIESYIKTFKNAWGKTGQELRLDAPYISRSGLLDYLVEEMGIKEPTARVYLTPGSTGKLIHDLLNAQIIKPHENGWIVIANDLVSVMMIGMKNGRQ